MGGKNMSKICASCGAQLEDSATFCAKCGKPVSLFTPQPEAAPSSSGDMPAAENFAGLANEKYGSYNYSKTTDYNGLKSEFAWELNCFNLAMETYQKKYGPYQFPPDCPKEKILNDIQIYIQKMQNNKDKMLYYMMIDIINGKKVNTDFTDLYKDLDKNANNKFDPRKLNKIVGPLN